MKNGKQYYGCGRGDATWGRLFNCRPDDRKHIGGYLWTVRYYDTETGKAGICPDDRCPNHKPDAPVEQDGCAICCRTINTQHLTIFSDRDVAFFRTDGMLNDGSS